MMKRYLLAFLLAAAAFGAQATDYYVCRCDTSADSRCAAGNAGASDSNNGTAPVFTTGTNGPWLTSTKIKSVFSTRSPGDRILMCRGGAIDLTDAMATSDLLTNLTNTGNNAAGTPPTNLFGIEDYTPSWMPAGESGTATSVTATTLTRTGAGWTTNQWVGYDLIVTDPSYGVPQYVKITANTSSQLTVQNKIGGGFYDTPSNTTTYTIEPPAPIINVFRAAGIGLEFSNSGSAALGVGFKVKNLDIRGKFAGVVGASFSGDGTTATVNATAHGMATGRNIIVSGASNAAFNKRVTITKVNNDQFTYSCAGCTGTPTGASYYSLGQYGINIYNGKHWLTFENLRIDGFGIGFSCNGGATTTPTSGDGVTRFVTLRKSQLTNNDGVGYGGGCNQVLVENNRFDSNGLANGDHQVYMWDPASVSGVKPVVVKGNQFRFNILKNNSINGPGNCLSTAYITHGRKDDLLVFRNKIAEPSVPSSGSSSQCWGLSIDPGYNEPDAASALISDEEFNRPAFIANDVINYALGIGMDNSVNGIIAANNIYTEYQGATCIEAPRAKYFQPKDGNDRTPTGTKIVSNSCYHKNPNASSRGIKFADNENSTQKLGGGHVVASNLIIFATGGLSEATSSTACLDREWGTTGLRAGFGTPAISVPASPAVFTVYTHNMVANQAFFFAAGTVPSPLALNTVYYVKTVVDGNNFTMSSTPGGTEINTTSGSSSSLQLSINVGVVTNGSSDVTYTSHGLVADQRIKFGTAIGNISSSTWYYVLSAGLTTDTFRFSTTKGGTAFVPNTSGTSRTMQRATAASLMAAQDNNLCYSANGLAVFDSISGSLANWQADSGLDTNSSTSNPNVTTPASPDFHIDIPASGPAYNTGNATWTSRQAKGGCLRSSIGTKSIGWMEPSCSTNVPPAAPNGGTIN